MSDNRFPIRIPRTRSASPYDVLKPMTGAEVEAWMKSPEGQRALDDLFAELKLREPPYLPTPCVCPGHVFG